LKVLFKEIGQKTKIPDQDNSWERI